jgi:hypothetical protein
VERSAIILFLILFLTACEKYEKDEFISLRKPEKRLKLSAPYNSKTVKFNGQKLEDVTWTFGFQKDNEFRWRLSTPNQELEASGSWDLTDDKGAIVLDYSNGGVERWEIEKLYRKDLIMELESGGDRILYKGEGHR